MENSGSYIFCTLCQTRLKRQVLGSNIFYYCRNCGCLISEAHLADEIKAFRAREQLSVDAQRTLVKT